MKLKNIELEPFIGFLMSFELIGRESRLRTRFAKILIGRQEQIIQEHQELIKQFANLDEDGNIKIIERTDGTKIFDVKDKDSFNREYALLMSEDCIIEENEERKDIILFVKDLVLNCEKQFKGKEAFEYDRWCEIVLGE